MTAVNTAINSGQGSDWKTGTWEAFRLPAILWDFFCLVFGFVFLLLLFLCRWWFHEFELFEKSLSCFIWCTILQVSDFSIKSLYIYVCMYIDEREGDVLRDWAVLNRFYKCCECKRRIICQYHMPFLHNTQSIMSERAHKVIPELYRECCEVRNHSQYNKTFFFIIIK